MGNAKQALAVIINKLGDIEEVLTTLDTHMFMSSEAEVFPFLSFFFLLFLERSPQAELRLNIW